MTALPSFVARVGGDSKQVAAGDQGAAGAPGDAGGAAALPARIRLPVGEDPD